MTLGTMFGEVLESLFRRPATQRYPFEREPVPARLRGQLCWDPEACVGCGLCARECPADALEVITLDKKAKRFVIHYHLDRCTFCAQCVESCRFGCLEMGSERWELAALSRKPFDLYYGEPADVDKARRGTGADEGG